MSYTAIYAACADGELIPEREFQNAWLGAMAVWNGMAQRYCDLPNFPLFDKEGARRVWHLRCDPAVPEQDRVTLATTLDKVLVPGDQLRFVADCLEHTASWIEHSHLGQQASCLRELAENGDVRAVAWNQTSVCADTWQVWDPETDEPRAYNIDRDQDHLWLNEVVTCEPAPEVSP